MQKSFIDMTGKRVKSFVVEGIGARDKRNAVLWQCKCVCGAVRLIYGQTLRLGKVHCKCQNKPRKSQAKPAHMKAPSKNSRHPLYSTWNNMLHRCYNPKSSKYKNYGARGITVVERWHSLMNFVQDMGERPPKTTLDRIDNNGPYSPDNCRWATAYEQASNKRNNNYLVFSGQKATATEWARNLEVSFSTVKRRMEKGWTEEKITHKGAIPFSERNYAPTPYKDRRKAGERQRKKLATG